MISGEVVDAPKACDECNAVFVSTMAHSCHVSAHLKFELTCGDMNVNFAATKHCNLAICCDCGHETIARPASGLCSHVEGRRRDLQMSERCLVGLMLAAIMLLMAGTKWSCQCNRHEVDTKLPGLAGEILNDWDAVITFVGDPDVPPTNNDDAERAHRNAVIFRRLSFDTRSDEGSRLYTAALSVIDTCRKHRTDP